MSDGTAIRLFMNSESQHIQDLLARLLAQPRRPFPLQRQPLEAPSAPGVYVIRQGNIVLHVGRTLRGDGGLRRRLMSHLHGMSSFTRQYLNGHGASLRETGYSYQYLELADPRTRALLEAHAIGTLCPKHLGLGE